MKQRIIEGRASYAELGSVLGAIGCKKYLLVYTNSAKKLPIWEHLESLGIPYLLFSGFTPNPKYEEIEEGVALFNSEGCDAVVAVGGGSAIDVAKCIKLYAKMSNDELYLNQEYVDTGISLVAIPTTAGTGSESTPFSVIYYKGEKQSVHHSSILPDVAILDPDVLEGLPLYQKKCTMLDALCQAIESWWSVKSTAESREYAKEAVCRIVASLEEYLNENTPEARREIMLGSNLAGRAICITSTTAPHAMSYKLTTTYSYPHGHSVAISLPRVWRYMLENTEKCNDKRGSDYLVSVFEDIAHAMGYSNAKEAADGFEEMLDRLGIAYPCDEKREEMAQYFADSVNTLRLGNNPVSLDNFALYQLYKGMIKS